MCPGLRKNWLGLGSMRNIFLHFPKLFPVSFCSIGRHDMVDASSETSSIKKKDKIQYYITVKGCSLFYSFECPSIEYQRGELQRLD